MLQLHRLYSGGGPPSAASSERHVLMALALSAPPQLLLTVPLFPHRETLRRKIRRCCSPALAHAEALLQMAATGA
jgi:hypothetical protein